eukprot:s2832_g4.t2
MPQVLRCKTWSAHRARSKIQVFWHGRGNWQARLVQINFNLARTTDWGWQPLGSGATVASATSSSWCQQRFPRGRTNDFNNASKMVAGVVKTSSWRTSGGMGSTYSGAFGLPGKTETSWQQELAALRAEASFPKGSSASTYASGHFDGSRSDM